MVIATIIGVIAVVVLRHLAFWVPLLAGLQLA